jgi:hypothetical protein
MLKVENKINDCVNRDGKLTAEAREGMKVWTISWDGPETNEWYFLELSWDPLGGLKMFANLKLVASDTRARIKDLAGSSSDGRMYLGRANTGMRNERYGSATIDDMEILFGERSKLIDLNFLSRGINVFYLTSKIIFKVQ